MKKQFKWIWYAIWAVICLVGGGGTLFSWMPRTPGMFYGGCAMLVVAVVAGVILLLMAKGKHFKKALLPGVIAGVVYAGILALIVYLCDEVIFADVMQHLTLMWEELNKYPWQTGIWAETFPQLAQLHFDVDRAEDALFMGNTANSKVNGNVFVNLKNDIGEINSYPAKYSDISNNAVYDLDMLDEIFVDPENGDYRLREDSIVYDVIPDFEDIPIEKIGRE